jgi:hypothetical protein
MREASGRKEATDQGKKERECIYHARQKFLRGYARNDPPEASRRRFYIRLMYAAVSR